jgi:hypothetical protein
MDDINNRENRFNLEEFSKKSGEFYNQIKAELESKFKGKYVALDFESKQYWIGETATEALTRAKSDFPNKLFYLLQIGTPAPFSIQSIRIRPYPRPKYDFAR